MLTWSDVLTSAGALNVNSLSCHEIEQAICGIWRDELSCEVSPCDDLFELVGDSLPLLRTVSVAQRRGMHVKSSVALRDSTPARIAEYLTVDDSGA